MNKTQLITRDWLLQCGLTGHRLLLEGLLRRGFLAYEDDEGVWLGTGSHPEDLEVLKLVTGLKVEPVLGHADRMARLTIRSSRIRTMDVAVRIVAIPENRSFIGGGDVLVYRWGWTWVAYRNMVWGTKIATCPTRLSHLSPLGYNALDIGVALLVKAFPLARVATNFDSCDGHGEWPARIQFRLQWDGYWAKAVFDVLGEPTPNSTWKWGGGEITPRGVPGTFSNAEVLGMLEDIQNFARRLMQRSTINRIGRARARTLEVFGDSAPNADQFRDVARDQLAEEFS